MSNKRKLQLFILFALGILVVALIYLSGHDIAVLQPKGAIGQKERNLIFIGLGLSVIVVIPVFAMLITIVWKYREGNTKAKYDPTLTGSRKLETIWWLIPSVIILILSIITWNSSHDLDPFKPIYARAKPINIQVIAMQWKWLFIYPEQNIASVNFVQFPVNTPVNFEITSDAPMNSFWIPDLGGQIYAMSGMSTQLHLIASKTGDFPGRSANISGKGFAGMNFTARASDSFDFSEWAIKTKVAQSHLDISSYNQLLKPSENNPAAYYVLDDPGLYDRVVSKYMAHTQYLQGGVHHE
jgi:cytochrome o ubiquinol oxidase subunit 2